MSELERAMEAMNKRKAAVTGGTSNTAAGEVVYDEGLRLFLVGFDLDFEEIKRIAGLVAAQQIQAVALRGPDNVPESFAGVWLDGILTGLTLAEHRREREAPPEDPNGVCPECHSTVVSQATPDDHPIPGSYRCTECGSTWRGVRRVIE